MQLIIKREYLFRLENFHFAYSFCCFSIKNLISVGNCFDVYVCGWDERCNVFFHLVKLFWVIVNIELMTCSSFFMLNVSQWASMWILCSLSHLTQPEINSMKKAFLADVYSSFDNEIVLIISFRFFASSPSCQMGLFLYSRFQLCTRANYFKLIIIKRNEKYLFGYCCALILILRKYIRKINQNRWRKLLRPMNFSKFESCDASCAFRKSYRDVGNSKMKFIPQKSEKVLHASHTHTHTHDWT